MTKKEALKLKKGDCVVCTALNPPEGFHYEYVFQLRISPKDVTKLKHNLIKVEIDLNDSKENGWDHDYFRKATEAEQLIYFLYNRPVSCNAFRTPLSIEVQRMKNEIYEFI